MLELAQDEVGPEMTRSVDSQMSKQSNPLIDGSISDLGKPQIQYAKNFLETSYASRLMDRLKKNVEWHQPRIFIYGRWVQSPRLAAWYGDKGAVYRYSNMINEPLPWIDELLDLRSMVVQACGNRFNSVLANYYRSGADSMGWHSDDESELGPDPLIASVSLGGDRRFLFRHRKDKHAAKHEVTLEHGSLLVMDRSVQSEWQHAIPKTKREVLPRINLTFRYVEKSSEVRAKTKS